MMKASILALVLALAACAPAPQTAKKKDPPKPPEPVGAQKAFFQMYAATRRWAPDANGFQMQSITTASMAQTGGKFAGWRAIFVSPSRRASRTYTFSAVEDEGLSKGISQGQEESYSGPRGQNSDWPIQALKIESDKALEAALTKGKGAEFSKKNPTIPITMQVEKIKKFGNPVYRVIWGASASTSSFSVYVDASTGEYLETVR